MKRLALLLGVVGMMLVLFAPTALGTPAIRFTEDATGGIFGCESTTYAIVSGEFVFLFHDETTPSGNHFMVNVTPRNVVAQDEAGDLYAVRGAHLQSGGQNLTAGVGMFTFTEHFQILSLSGGGIADSVNVTIHVTQTPDNIVLKDIDVGTCSP